jgi:hypothetical protein
MAGKFKVWRWRRKDQFSLVAWESTSGLFDTVEAAWQRVSRLMRYDFNMNFEVFPDDVDPNEPKDVSGTTEKSTGRLVEVTWEGSAGEATFEHSNGFNRRTIDKDTLGKVMGPRFLNEEIRMYDWLPLTKIEYLETNIMLCSFYKPVGSLYNDSRVKWHLDSEGRSQKLSFVNRAGTQVCLPDEEGGYSSIDWRYGTSGELLAQRFLGVDSEPFVSTTHGYAFVNYVYNDQHQPIEICYRDKNQRPLAKGGQTGPEITDHRLGLIFPNLRFKQPGIAYEQTSYDHLGRRVETRNLDEERRLVDASRIAWDDQGNIVEQVYFDERRRVVDRTGQMD